MKKVFLISATFFISLSSAFAVGFETPIPAEDDDVTLSGPSTKYSLATQMRVDAFQNAEISISFDIPENRKKVQLYKPSKTNDYLQKVKIPNAKVIEYTNGSFDIKFKDSPFVIYTYDKNGDLQEFAKITNKGKIPFTSYHYDVNGQIKNIEIKPQYYRSYIYDLNGLLIKYCIDDKVYSSNGKLLRRKKGFI